MAIGCRLHESHVNTYNQNNDNNNNKRGGGAKLLPVSCHYPRCNCTYIVCFVTGAVYEIND